MQRNRKPAKLNSNIWEEGMRNIRNEYSATEEIKNEKKIFCNLINLKIDKI